ncbi:DUF1330 domain-containing protein [Paraburkholderia xenovorans]
MTQKGYLYAELTVTDPARFHDEYMPRVRPVLKEYGATFLIATDHPDVVEGGRTVKRIIVLEFETPEIAHTFYYSEAYQEVMRYRTDSAETHLYLLDGLPVDG